ncbi:hypothetical protein CEXT_330891 [Caerostris extrusa]|uniref:Uncharacterized protein n=1 Tax=Caerostris extrusa TaxID=172846 RepID=A0AAV4P749_CAEEX|nr:hypothetical protein CEXT_330891 [Caerostris extrusa]
MKISKTIANYRMTLITKYYQDSKDSSEDLPGSNDGCRRSPLATEPCGTKTTNYLPESLTVEESLLPL